VAPSALTGHRLQNKAFSWSSNRRAPWPPRRGHRAAIMTSSVDHGSECGTPGLILRMGSGLQKHVTVKKSHVQNWPHLMCSFDCQNWKT